MGEQRLCKCTKFKVRREMSSKAECHEGTKVDSKSPEHALVSPSPVFLEIGLA